MNTSKLHDFLAIQVEKNPDHFFISNKEYINGINNWRHYSYNEIQQLANKVSQILIDEGLQKDDKIAIISENRVEWNIVDFAAIQLGIIVVPMYPNISSKDYHFIFNDASIKIAFVGNFSIYQKVFPILNDTSLLNRIISFDTIEQQQRLFDLLPNEVDIQEIDNRKAKVNIDDIATIIYTSGTTGNPKGVMLTHKNIVSNVLSVKEVTPFHEGKKTLSFLPLCHSFERMVFYAYLAFGMHIHYAENLETIADNLKEVKPFCFTTVPRLLEKVYEKIIAKGNKLSGIKKHLFDWSIALGLKYDVGGNKSFGYTLQLDIARKLVFKKWKEALGNEIEFIITGAAAMQPRLIQLFTAAGIQIIEGYGLTETSPVLCSNRIDEQERCIGTVGLPIPNIEIQLADDGEILAKGDNIMKGYYNRPDLTAEVISADGWFRTGDIGQWISKNGKQFLKITDRKKELFKTAGGKYIAPQVIENKMKESPFVEQIMVVGGDDKKYIVALIVPSFIQLENWAKINSISYNSVSELIQHNKTWELIQQEIDRININFGKWEQIKNFELIPHEWSVETGELTPTMKLKRKIIENKYSDIVNRIYNI